MEAGLLYKAAAVKKLDPLQILKPDDQWVLPGIQKLIEESLENGFPELVIEWAILLKKKGKVLPANVLTMVMRHFSKNPDQAVLISKVLGPRGNILAANFGEFALFDELKWKDPLSYKLKVQRKTAFEMLRDLHPDQALQYLIDRFSNLNEEDKRKFLECIITSYRESDNLLLDLLSRSKSQTSQALYLNLLLLSDREFYVFHLQEFTSKLNTGQLSSFRFELPGKTQNQLSQEWIWSNISPDLILEAKAENQVFEYLKQHQLESDFVKVFRFYPQTELRNHFFKWLVRNHQLTENFPVEQLSFGMDFHSFNSCCQYWLDTSKDKIDLEAFYKASRHPRHFWSDQICRALVALAEIPSIQKKYDMDVFWQMSAFKINPNSEFIGQLPESCRFYINEELNFEQVIRFRKWIRVGS